MKNIFKKDAAGKTVLSKVFNKTTEVGTFFAEAFSGDFVDMAKGEESDFIHLSGDKSLQRACGILTAPITIPALCIMSVPASLLIGLEEGIGDHVRDVEEAKKDNKFDIM